MPSEENDELIRVPLSLSEFEMRRRARKRRAGDTPLNKMVFCLVLRFTL
jgi:hypothetical protein